MTTELLIPKGCYFAPPYLIDRYTHSTSGRSIDFTRIRNSDVWEMAFTDNEIDWINGWRSYWRCAGAAIATGSDYSPDRISLELEAFFSDGTQWSRGLGIACDISDKDEWAEKAINYLEEGLNDDVPIAGMVGLVRDGSYENLRPCLTFIVSGPNGGIEAAMMVNHLAAKHGMNFGGIIRDVRQDSAGVVKFWFSPEIAKLANVKAGFGIDWNIWPIFAKQQPEMEWGTACLAWCDFAAAAAEQIRDEIPLMVDQIYFDFISVVPICPQNSADSLLGNPAGLLEQMDRKPFEWLYPK